MIAIGVAANIRPVAKAFRRLAERTPVVTAQELNKQRNQVRTITTRGLSKAAGITPQKRVRRRILRPRKGKATRSRLVSMGMTLFESFPPRYFKRGVPAGAALKPAGTDRHGRSRVGGVFTATMPKSGYTGQFQRLNPRRHVRRKQTQPPKDVTGLPIANAFVVDLTRPGYRIRGQALLKMAREWPERWAKRMRGEIKRLFR